MSTAPSIGPNSTASSQVTAPATKNALPPGTKHGTTALGSAKQRVPMPRNAQHARPHPTQQPPKSKDVEKQHWPLWEIFIRSRQGLSHRHVGSLHAADAEMAIENARDVYTRRQEGVSIWAVPASEITASSPDEKDVLFDPADDKVYRHPTFYDLPDEVKNM